jgi:hypothetical protein
MTTSSDTRLRELMAEDGFPWGTAFRMGESRVVTVSDFRRYATDSGLDVTDGDLDKFVERIGGKRQGMIDPWSFPIRLVRRLAGKENPTTDFYILPPAA